MKHDNVLITGIGGPAGRSAVAYFREKGFYVIGTDIKDVETCVESFYMIPPAGDPSFTSTLLDIVRKEGPSLLIPTVTEELPAVARLKRIIEGFGCTVFISTPLAIDIANDKLKTVMIMAGHGVPVPVSFDEVTPRDLMIKNLGLPLLSKPRYGRGGRGVVVYEKPEELFADGRTGLIFQEFIPGEEFDVNLFIGRDGEVLSVVVLKKILLKEGIVGNAIAVERVENKEVAQLGIMVAEILKLKGPVDMDIRLREDGTPVLLEINARLGGNVLSAGEILDSLLAAWEKEKEKDERLCKAWDKAWGKAWV